MKNIMIKWHKLVVCFGLSLGAVLAFVSCGDDLDTYETGNPILYGLEISDHSYAFPAEGGEFTVTVTTTYSEGWDIAPAELTWFVESGRTENTITFAAPANPDDEVKTLEVNFIAGDLSEKLILTQETTLPPVANMFILDTGILASSPDGMIIVTYDQDETDSSYNIYTINTLTNDKVFAFNIGSSGFNGIHAVSNNGIMLGSYTYEDDFYVENGELKSIQLPSGYNAVALNDINADGTIIVGYGVRTNDGQKFAMKWTNGVPEILDGPTTGRINGSTVTLVSAQSVSPDGQYIVGRAYTGSNAGGLYWKNGEWNWLGEIIEKEVEVSDFWGNTYLETREFICNVGPNEVGKFSSNSRYSGVLFEAWGDSFFGKSKVNVPALFDFETEEMVFILDNIVDEDAGSGGVSRHTTDDGGLFYVNNVSIQAVTPFARFRKVDGTVVEGQEYIENMFGLHVGSTLSVLRLIENELVIGTFKVGDAYVSFYLRPTTNPIQGDDGSEE